MQSQAKHAKSETYNYTQPNLPTNCAKGCSKVKVHELARSLLKFIWLGMDFSNYADQRITDLSINKKSQTFNVQIIALKF